jgi:hypothetical protein
MAASRAEGLLSELQAGAGVAASEQNAADLALLARFYQERQMRPLWIIDRTVTCSTRAWWSAREHDEAVGVSDSVSRPPGVRWKQDRSFDAWI